MFKNVKFLWLFSKKPEPICIKKWPFYYLYTISIQTKPSSNNLLIAIPSLYKVLLLTKLIFMFLQMFLDWVQIFFLTDFRNILFIAIETQIKIMILIQFLTKCIHTNKYEFFHHCFMPKKISMIPLQFPLQKKINIL